MTTGDMRGRIEEEADGEIVLGSACVWQQALLLAYVAYPAAFFFFYAAAPLAPEQRDDGPADGLALDAPWCVVENAQHTKVPLLPRQCKHVRISNNSDLCGDY